MRPTARVFLLVLCSIFAARHRALAQTAAPDSSTSVGARGIFHARIPGPAEMTVDSTVYRTGVVRRTRWRSTMDHPTYTVRLTEYPAGTISRFPPAQVLREEAEKLATQVGGTLQSSEISLASHPGLALTITKPGAELRGRMFLAGNRLYLIYVLFAPTLGAPEGEAFLASFAFNPG